MKGLGKILTYVVLSAIGCTMLIPFFWMCSTALKPDAQMERDNWIPTKQYVMKDGVEYEVTEAREAEDGAGVYVVRRKETPRARMALTLSAQEAGKRVQNGVIHVKAVPYTVVASNPLPGDDATVRLDLERIGEPEMVMEVSTKRLTQSRRSTKEFTYSGDNGDTFSVRLVEKKTPVAMIVSALAPKPLYLKDVYSDDEILRRTDTVLTVKKRLEFVKGREDGLEYEVLQRKRLPNSSGKYRVRPQDEADQRVYGERVVSSADVSFDQEDRNQWLATFDESVGPVEVELLEVIEPAKYEVSARHVRRLKEYRVSETEVDERPALQWRNFKRAVAVGGNFGRSYINSIVIAIIVVTGQVFTSSLAAYSFSRLKFPGRDTLFLGYLATMMIPAAVTMIPVFVIIKSLPLLLNGVFNTHWFSYNLYFMFQEYQTYVGKPIGLDSYFALVVPLLFSAYGTFMLRQFFMSLPTELEDAARMDGCGTWGIYTNVILPLSKPALAALTIFTFLGAWRNFLWPLVVTNNPKLEPLPVMLATFMGVTGTQWNLLMAGTLLFLGPMIVVFIAGQKFFVEGIQLGGVKG